MYRKKNRTTEIARRTLVYTIMVLAVLTLLFVITFNMLGYQYNLQTRTVEQRGLVQYDSRPRNATVFVDGKELGSRTQTKSMVDAGQHQFSMRLEGYDEWRKVMDIKPGTLTALSYVRLVPTERKVSVVKELPAVSSARFSPDRRWALAVVPTERLPRLSWIDLRNNDEVKVVDQTIDAVLTGHEDEASKHELRIIEWDLDSRYVLARHQYTLSDGTTGVQWLRLDREGREPVDISRLASLELKDVRFIGGGGNELYVLQTSGELRRMAVNGATLSGPLLTRVASFSVYGTDYVAYVGTDEAAKRLAGIWKKEWQEPVIVRRLSEAEKDKPLFIEFARYFHKDALAVAVGAETTVYYGDLGRSESELAQFYATGKKMSAKSPLTALDMSYSGRFVMMRSSEGFMTYDIEHQLVSQDAPLAASARLDWLDDHHVWHLRDGVLMMREYDGTNETPLMAANELAAMPSSDEKSLYSFKTLDDGRVVLQRLKMTVN